MNDSDLDFVNLPSKLVKRVPKKTDDSRRPRKCENKSSSQTTEGDTKKKQRNEGREKLAATQPAGNRNEKLKLPANDSGDAGSSSAVSGGQSAKDKVTDRMQQFKRNSPQKMQKGSIQPTRNDKESSSFIQHQTRDIQTFSSDLQEALQEDSDEALALRLQQELDQESAQAQIVDLEDGGLFFCQMCHKDLSHMTPEGRTQHLNRCLDESEDSAPAPSSSSGIPDCPICGKKFKSKKSRSTHLKRCSSDMGVSPAVLLQALQRQAEEGQSTLSYANTNPQTLAAERKGPPRPGLHGRKKNRTKPQDLDEETMVALALSSSMQEMEREQQGGKAAERLESVASHSCRNPVLKWQQEAGKGRGKRKKGGVPRPPPLLLVQDAQAALTRLQERVSALLLRSRAPSPPTPTRCPSTLRGWDGAAPLWQRSSLLDGVSTGLSEFYSLELREFFTSCGSPTTNMTLINKPQSSVQRAQVETPSSEMKTSTPDMGQLLVGSQALQDLMELAEDGMTLTQYRNDEKGLDVVTCQTTNLRLSGCVEEEEEEESAELCASGFLPETATRHSDSHRRVSRVPRQSPRSVSLSRLASDLSGMVNNPQLSDVQLQVDSGDIFFAHSFMIYARCPLLAEMVHESGFGVQEEGMIAGQRVLVNDVPGQAVLTLLQYLYTGNCSVTASLQPHVLELASRFDLQELKQLCQNHKDDPTPLDEANHLDQEENVSDQTDQVFVELLRSMWVEGEEEEDDGTDSDRARNEGRRMEDDHQADNDTADDREMNEEQVNEKELEEIYEFAATQKKKEKVSEEEDVEEKVLDEHVDGESKLTDAKTGLDATQRPTSRLHPSLDRSYDRLFSDSYGVYEEGNSGMSKTQPSQSKQHSSPNKPSPDLSCRAFRQSSMDNLSFSPPPSSSNLPVPSMSPHQLIDSSRYGDKREDDVKLDESTKQECDGPHSVCAPLSPHSPHQHSEPELIVLSDSSEDMEVDVAVLSPSSPFHRTLPNTQSDTEVTTRQTLPPAKPAMGNIEPSSEDWSPGDPLHCSPEVSWLIPSTPLQPSRSTATSSIQTNSTIRRTQLFPKGQTSPPMSCAFSSPASPLHTSGLNTVPRKNSDRDASKDVEMCAPSQTKRPRLSKVADLDCFKQTTPLHLQAPPHSSTPLHREPSDRLPASPLHSDAIEPRWGRSVRLISESPSHSSEQSHSHSSPSRPQSSERLNKSSKQQAAESKSGDDGEVGKKQVPDTGRVNDCGQTDSGDGETNVEAREAGETESSFQHSFMDMDEPPLAFNDSWGLDACADDNPGCFSLRLEDSSASKTTDMSSSAMCHPAPTSHAAQSVNSHGNVTPPSPPQVSRRQSSSSPEPNPGPSFIPSPPDRITRTPADFDKDLLDSKIWGSWEEEEEEEEEEEDVLPLSQRVNPSTHLKTPTTSSRNKQLGTLVPITPMPHYSDMDTPELKTKLNKFGVRPLPKRQMILKLREIHQYTHQLASSDSEDEAQRNPAPSRAVDFKEPKGPLAPPPLKHNGEGEGDREEESLSASQGSNTSSTAASEESERSNPELCVSSEGDSDSDCGISSSQATSRLQDCLLAVRSFILSDTELYSRILHYEPLVLSQLQQQLKAAGIRLGAAKLIDYLDSQCITFTTAKPGQRHGNRGGRRAKSALRGGVRRKRGGSTLI